MKNFHERVQCEIREGIAWVGLCRPGKHNGMDFPMLRGVIEAARSLRAERRVRAVILYGEGPSFCAGLDVKAVMATPVQAAAGFATLWKPTRNDFQAWSMGWRELGLPVIAAIHGNCFGAGIQLALGADIRIATPDARLSVMEAKWGLVPDMGGAALLRELVPIDVAKELTFTGRTLSGSEALALGLVTRVDAAPLAAAEQLAREIATRSPDAVAAGKFLLQEAWSADETGALASERKWQRRVLGRSNQRVAVANNLQQQSAPYKPRSIC